MLTDHLNQRYEVGVVMGKFELFFPDMEGSGVRLKVR